MKDEKHHYIDLTKISVMDLLRYGKVTALPDYKRDPITLDPRAEVYRCVDAVAKQHAAERDKLVDAVADRLREHFPDLKIYPGRRDSER